MSMFWVSVVGLSIGADMQMHASKDAAKAANKTSYFNANEKRMAAAQEFKVAAENSRRKEQENQQILARLRAANAASGLQMEGSPLAIFGETAELLQRDILDLSLEAESRRRALLVGAHIDEVEGANQAAGIRNQGTASAIGSIGSLGMNAGQAKGYFS